MLIIKNKEELAKLVSKDKDLIIDEDVKIEYQVEKGELRDVKCKNLYLENDNQKFNFNGRDFIGWDFIGKKVSYNAFFNCYGRMKCESYKARRKIHAEPIALMGIEIIKPKASYSTDDAMRYEAIKEAIENASPDTIYLIYKMLCK